MGADWKGIQVGIWEEIGLDWAHYRKGGDLGGDLEGDLGGD